MDYFKKNQKALILATLWISLFAVFWLLSEVLLPFILAILLAYVLNPLVKKIKLPRWMSVLLIYSCIGIIIYLFSIFFLPELYQELIKLAKTATEKLNNLRETDLQEFAGTVDSYIKHYHYRTFRLHPRPVCQHRV